MPRPRFQRLSPERRAQILETAAKHFAEHGYDRASLNRILAECAVSKGAAYYYFDDKADLFSTVVEEAVRVGLDTEALRMDDVDAASFWPWVRGLYVRQLLAYREHPHLWRVVKSATDAVGHERDGARIAERLAPLVEMMGGLLQRALALGVVRTDLPLDLLVSMIGGLDDALDRWFLAHPDAIEPPDGGPMVAAAFESLRQLAASREV
ncbi:MAG: TetR/AcrR family transcriptional regulator [Deltaproteobacteria bacterium]|nr:TetR/AcrR family transcriptional regulator [Deltaproteobacteria bacterium]